jgi:hypothetical protein
MTKTPIPKSEWNVTKAVAWLPSVELGNRGGKWSMGVDVHKGKEFIGSFYIGKGGITFVKSGTHKDKETGNPKGKRRSWRKLAEQMSQED